MNACRGCDFPLIRRDGDHASWCPTRNPTSPMILPRRGPPRKRRAIPTQPANAPIDEAEMWRLYGYGYSYTEIALIMDRSRYVIAQRIKSGA